MAQTNVVVAYIFADADAVNIDVRVTEVETSVAAGQFPAPACALEKFAVLGPDGVQRCVWRLLVPEIYVAAAPEVEIAVERPSVVTAAKTPGIHRLQC